MTGSMRLFKIMRLIAICAY